MRILHTSDWHLGRNLFEHSLREAQSTAVDHIIDQAIANQVELFIVAGDVFDRQWPSTDDVRLLNRAVTRLYEAGIPVVITAGNHDDGVRLGAYSEVLVDGVHIVGEIADAASPIQFADAHGPVVVYPVPYLDPDLARGVLSDDPEQKLARSHEAVMTAAMARVRSDFESRKNANPATRAVVVGHAFVVRGNATPEEVSAERSESERDLTVGGLQTIPAGVFDGVHFVALGHLHRPHEVVAAEGSRPAIRYSGSLLRYSLSEAAHTKTFTLVELDELGAVSYTDHPIPQPAGMARLKGSLAELLSDKYAQHFDDFVELKVEEEFTPPNAYALLQDKYRRILTYDFGIPRDLRLGGAADAGGAQLESPLQTMSAFYKYSLDKEPTEQSVKLMEELFEAARKAVEK